MLPSDYLQSRQTFLDLADKAGAEVRRFYLQDNEGDAERLSTDVALLGPANASTLLVIASGTHGIEGYAGSACQFRFLREYGSRYASSGLGFLLVHAVNPWGYFHDRRVTREGIDLNRNFVDFPRASDDGGYDAFHDRLVTQYRPLPAGWWNELCLMSSALSGNRRKAIQAAVTAGQYRYADGLFYGGKAPAESRLVWEAIIDQYAQDRERLFLLDIHTGLGKFGVGELITHLPASSQEFRRVSAWFNGELKSMSSGESVSAAVGGTLTAAFERRFPAKAYTLGLEFGTVPALKVLNAMRADHWYHRNAAQLGQREREWVRSRMKQAFAPSDEAWYSRVMVRFDQVLGWTVAALSR